MRLNIPTSKQKLKTNIGKVFDVSNVCSLTETIESQKDREGTLKEENEKILS